MAASEALPSGPLAADELRLIDGWWRAANYLSVGQIYLLGNPLLREPLAAEHVKPRLLGHWGTTPGLNLIWAHLNRVIQARDLGVLYVTGPGHGGPGIVANAYLEGTYSELYAQIGRDERGLERLFRQFSFPGGIPSHAAPETPGSIHEGGELGYALAHAFGAAFDNPGLTVACVIGDGEAETGPLAASWHSNKFLDPAHDGAVLPILHLNGYKIASATVLARIPEYELRALLTGYGWRPLMVSGGFDGEDPARVHQLLAETLDEALDEIARIQESARAGTLAERPSWPMIVLRTPKGWTCPAVVDELPVEGTWRAHQVPIAEARRNDAHRELLEGWMRSYRPEELFDGDGALVPEIAALAPAGERRMSATPHANGGALLRDLILPSFGDYAVDVARPGQERSEATRVLGAFLRDVIAANRDNFRIVGPDETASNRLTRRVRDDDARVAGRARRDGRRAGARGTRHGGALRAPLPGLARGLSPDRAAWALQLLRGLHPHRRLDVQSAREVAQDSQEIPWRMPIASLNYLLTSHVWQQDHNGFSHQDPGFIDHVMNKKAEVIRVYLPPDANCLLSVMDHCLRSRNYVNVVVAGKAPALTYLTSTRRRRTARAGSASGSGHRTTTGRSPMSSWPVVATCRRSRRSRPWRSCASTCRSCACASSMSSISCGSSPTASIPTDCPMRSSTRSSRSTGRSSSPTTAIRG